jgi:glycosyltransferase involved in cell wall biosynthesis
MKKFENIPPTAPVGIMIPTLNCAHLLPSHLDSMQPWLDFVSEIVVVDSHSNDGTIELIRERLKHPGLRIFSHPRGLYQSWNFGIRQITSKYTYVSTVGDSISRDGLEHLFAVAEQFQCDGVLSKPRAIDKDGLAFNNDSNWPIYDAITSLGIKEPALTESIQLFFFALLHIPGGILGSSASNLYRTEILQRFPFPTDFGTTGDGAWAIANLFDCRFAVTPEIISTFRYHPKAYTAKEYEVIELDEKLAVLARKTFERRATVDPALRAISKKINLDDLFYSTEEFLKWRWRLDAERGRKWPWVLNPLAWQARKKRNFFHRRLDSYKNKVIKSSGT